MSNEQNPNQMNNPTPPSPGSGTPQGWENTGAPAQPQGWENTGAPMQPQGWENTGAPQGWENTSWQQGQYPQQPGQPPAAAAPSGPSPFSEFIQGVTDFSMTKKLKAGFGKIYYFIVLIGSLLLWGLAVAYSFKEAFHAKSIYDGADIDVFWLVMGIFILLIGWIFALGNAAKARMTVDLARAAQQNEDGDNPEKEAEKQG